jgi:endoribonuclease LACTB2
MNIVNVGYDSTNYYVLADSSPKLLVDVGWPGTLGKLQHQCRRAGVDLAALKYFVLTHYHPDHAGLAEELKWTGCRLVVLEPQVAAAGLLGGHMKPRDGYVEINLADAVRLHVSKSRVFLARLGIEGEIVETPGHSEDSVSLVLDEGAAFTGDLTAPVMIEDKASAAYKSWERLKAMKVERVYPGHGPVWKMAL